MIHPTADFIGLGWEGNRTLELANVSHLPITLYKGMKICQVGFQQLTTPSDSSERPYRSAGLNSRRQGQVRPTASKIHIDFDERIAKS